MAEQPKPIINFGDEQLYAALRHAPEGSVVRVTDAGGNPIDLVLRRRRDT